MPNAHIQSGLESFGYYSMFTLSIIVYYYRPAHTFRYKVAVAATRVECFSYTNCVHAADDDYLHTGLRIESKSFNEEIHYLLFVSLR